MRKYIPFLTVWLVLILTPLVAAQPGIFAVMPISSDPYTNPDAQHQTQLNMASFAYGDTIVAAFESGRYQTEGGATNIGWAVSNDGGNSYSIGFLPGTTPYSTPPGPWSRVLHPAVAYDARHNVWLITAATSSPSDGIVSRSTDGGLSWSDPIVVSQDAHDQSTVACDNTFSSQYYGQCYFLSHGDWWSIIVETSTDGGKTWVPTTVLPVNGFYPQVTVRPNGMVVVVLRMFNLDGPQPYVSVVSLNAGQDWSRFRRLLYPQRTYHPFEFGGEPSLAVDDSGKVYVAFVDCRFRQACGSQTSDIVLTTATNGRNWSRLTRVPIDSPTSSASYFIPGLAVTGSGNTARLALTYYYFPDADCDLSTCQLYVGFISSADGGMTWAQPQALAGPMNLSWLPPADEPGKVVLTRYISATFVEADAVSVFAVAAPPIGDMIQLAAWGAINPVAATGNYSLPLRAEPPRGDPSR